MHLDKAISISIPLRLRHLNANSVFSTFLGGFGDLWAATSMFLTMSEIYNEPVKIACMDERISIIRPFLFSKGSIIEVNESPDVLIHSHQDTNQIKKLPFRCPDLVVPWSVVFENRYLPTKNHRWSANHSRRIVTQFIPRYPNSSKCCSNNDLKLFEDFFKERNYQTTKLGLPYSIDEILKNMSEAEFFVGVCSGMSHVAHSVGIPINLIRNGHTLDQISRAHQANECTIFRNMTEFIQNISF